MIKYNHLEAVSEKAMAPHSSTLAWKNPMDRGAWWAAVHGVAKSRTRLHFHFSLSCIGEGNGNPLQYSCLENPRDGRAWWAAVYGVAQSQTELKRLSSSSCSREKNIVYVEFSTVHGFRNSMRMLECTSHKGLQ